MTHPLTIAWVLGAILGLHGCDTVVIELGDDGGEPMADGSLPVGDQSRGDPTGDPPGDPTVSCHCRRYCREAGECADLPSTCDAGFCVLPLTSCSPIDECQTGEACLIDETTDTCG